MIEIKFPADNLEAARHLGAALTAYGSSVEAATASFKEFTEAARHIDAEKARSGVEADEKEGVETDADHYKEYIDVEKARSADQDKPTGTALSDEEAGAEPYTTKRPRLDEHGVQFSGEFCGTAAKPFYASGPNAGQWKKKQGMPQESYDEWYSSAKPEPVNTAGAFSPDTSATDEPDKPHDAGSLMAWVSSMQGAGRLTQDQVNSAYTQAGLTMPDIFPTDVNTPEVIAERVATLYNILSAWA